MSSNYSLRKTNTFERSPLTSFDYKQSSIRESYSKSKASPLISGRYPSDFSERHRENQYKENFFVSHKPGTRHFESPVVSTKYEQTLGEEHSYYTIFKQGASGKSMRASTIKPESPGKYKNDEMMLLLKEITLPPNVRKHLIDQELFSAKASNVSQVFQNLNNDAVIAKGTFTENKAVKTFSNLQESLYNPTKISDKVFSSPYDFGSKENNRADLLQNYEARQIPPKVTYTNIPSHHVRVNSASSASVATGKIEAEPRNSKGSRPQLTLSDSKSSKLLNVYSEELNEENTPRFKGKSLAGAYSNQPFSNHPYLSAKTKKAAKPPNKNDNILIITNNSRSSLMTEETQENQGAQEARKSFHDTGFMFNSMVFEESLNNCNLFSQFIRYSNEIIKYDIESCSIREKLSQRNDFPINEIFSYFDKKKAGRIGFEEIKEGLALFDMKLSEEEMNNLKRKFLREGKKVLSLQDFSAFFLPVNKKPAPSEKSDGISGEIKVLVSRLFNSCIKAEKLFMNLARKISANLPIHLLEIFKQLDMRNQGFFTVHDLNKAIESESRVKAYSGFEMEELMKRFDNRSKGKISYSDFSNSIVALGRERV